MTLHLAAVLLVAGACFLLLFALFLIVLHLLTTDRFWGAGWP